MDRRRGLYALIVDYLRFLLLLQKQKEIHPPLVFTLKKHLKEHKFPKRLKVLSAQHRNRFLQNSEILRFIHPLSGKSLERTVKNITIKDAKPPSLGLLIYNLVDFLKPKTLLEAGTSLGISTLYQAMAMTDDATLCTIEGASTISACAQKHFPETYRSNVKFVVSKVADYLNEIKESGKSLDWVFIDADHRHASLLNLCTQLHPMLSERSFVLIDDIRWSDGMFLAWEELRQGPGVAYSIDFFHMGLLILQPNTVYRHFYIRPKLLG